MAKVFLVDLESVPSRYTCEWKTHVPQLLQQHGHEVVVIEGPADIPSATTPGAFLNFGGTNIYKAAQVEHMGRLFCAGAIKPGDHFLFTDAWHPGIINLKYMSELLQIPVTIHALWHAGSYDPQDFLGRLIGGAGWVRHAEKSFFEAVDHNYFATEFHIELFAKTFGRSLCPNIWIEPQKDCGKIVRTGWPMEYMGDLLRPYAYSLPKRDLILFPHRIAPEKQVEIFRDLAAHMPQYEFVVCQDQQLTKEQYHQLLVESKIVFSANLQETLGISCYEGAVVGAIPMVPDRLSYVEMYDLAFRYPSEWTGNWDSYVKHRQDLIDLITKYITEYDQYVPLIEAQSRVLETRFFSAQELLKNIQ